MTRIRSAQAALSGPAAMPSSWRWAGSLVSGHAVDDRLDIRPTRLDARHDESERPLSLIILAVALEAIVGVALIVSPSPAAVLVFGGALSAPGEAIGRLAGVALLALAVACSPSAAKGPSSDLRGLLAYNLLATIFFLSVGIDGR